MGKKKSAKKVGVGPDRTPRKEPYAPARMNLVVERMREQVQKLSALARAMADAKVDSIVVDGHAMLLRGMNQIDNFIDNSSRAVREAKTSRESM